MTVYFVDDSGSNTSPYDTEAKAATSMATIAALWTAADIVRVSNGHLESTGSAITYVCPTTCGLRVLCVVFDGSGTGALSVGATIAVGAASSTFAITGNGYWYGVSLSGGSNNSTGSLVHIGSNGNLVNNLIMDTCTLNVPSANVTTFVRLGVQAVTGIRDAYIKCVNCTFNFGSAKTNGVQLSGGRIEIRGLILTGTAPVTLFAPQATASATSSVQITGSDLTGVAWTNILTASGNVRSDVRLLQCKLPTGFVLTTGAFTSPGGIVLEVSECHSGDNNYSYVKACYQGTVIADNTVYATAGNGTDSYSWLMTGNANTTFEFPLESPPIAGLNKTTGSAKTAKVAVTNDGTTYTNAQLWLEVLAKVTSGVPLGTWDLSDRVADIVTSGSNQTTDATTSWTGTGGFSSAVNQQLETSSFTPREIGLIMAVVKLAANDNVYLSPNLLVA